MKKKIYADKSIPSYSWWKFLAPVAPPLWVINKIKETGRYVHWQNYFFDGSVASTMFYYTRLSTEKEKEFYNDEIITHLLPGSPRPCDGWLQKIPYQIRIEEKPKP